ncbi:hypothetical protein ACJ41O_003061 [Fusarium nematophilum]
MRYTYGLAPGCSYPSGYSYGALSTQSSCTGHSREPSASRRSSAHRHSYAGSTCSGRRHSTEEHRPRAEHSPHGHTRDSSYAGRASSVDDDGLRSGHRTSSDTRRSQDVARRSGERCRHYYHGPHYGHYHRHHQHSHQTHLQPDTHSYQTHLRPDTHSKRRKAPKHPSGQMKEKRESPRDPGKVFVVKSKKQANAWKRISQSMGLAKPKEVPPSPSEACITPAVPKAKKKSKWKWWGKKKKSHERRDHYAPVNPKPEDMPEIKIEAPRPGMWEWLGGQPPPLQSPRTLKLLFEEDG